MRLPVYSPVGLGPLWKACLGRLLRRTALDRLRRRLADHGEAASVTLLGSGTQALQLAIEAAVPASGSHAVALPAYGCYDLVSAAVGAGRPVHFYDVLPETGTPDLRDVGSLADQDVRAIVVAPNWGLQPDWDELRAMARAHGWVLIEDAAQSHGSRWNEQPWGAMGDLSVLSFGPGKGWTGGGGGALLQRPDGPPPAEPAPAGPLNGLRCVIRAAVTTLASWPPSFRLLSALPLGIGETHYRAPRPPARMSAWAAEVILNTEKRALREAAGRRDIDPTSGIFTDEESTVPLRLFEGSRPGYLRFPVLLRGGWEGLRPERRRVLWKAGVRPGYPRPLPSLPEIQALRVDGVRSHFPGAERLTGELITLPAHSR